MTETDRIVRLLEKTFDKQPWYGCSINEILSRVNEQTASAKHGQPHTIIELVLHMASWRKFTTHRLLGDAEFEVTDETNFPALTTWADAVNTLHKSQEELVKAVKQFPVDRLNELVPSNRHKYTFYTLLHGIIQHDVYHLGQIALIQKLTAHYTGEGKLQ
jgi:uncharacterized damage-inducible protein DinB